MPKLMLLDGNSLVNRAFYGVRPLNAPDGTPTNALYGFLSILHKLLQEERPDHLAVAFDQREPTFRHKHSAAYKATRKPMPEELALQMPLLKETLDAMGLCRCELPGWEADDLLGTLSRRGAEEGWDCVLVTGDKDALQLVGEHVRVLNVKTRMGQTETIDYTSETFRSEYGFDPPRMVDLKALMGDSSDNIPGVPGVGEKTALELLRRFGSLDGVYENLPDESIKKGVRAKLEAGRDSAYDSYWLATIDRNAPLELPLADTALPEHYGAGLFPLFQRLGFARFIKEWGLQDLSSAEPGEAAPEKVFEGQCESVCPETWEELRAALALVGERERYYAYDASRREAALQYSVSDTLSRAVFLSPETYREEYAKALRELFTLPGPKAGHDVKNLLRSLLSLGVDAGEDWIFDSALAAYLLDSTAAGYELDSLCRAWCGFTPASAPGEENEQLSLALDGEDERRARAGRLGALASRAAAVEALEQVLRPKLRETEMEELLDSIEMPLCGVLARMEQAGFLVDRQALIAFGESLSGQIETLQRQIYAEAGEEFNINSPKQLSAILFDRMGLPGGKKTKTGWSTNAEVLERLSYVPIVGHVLEYRELTKLKSTYADGLLKVIGPDGRIHTNFQMTVTATGRLSSTEPNLQNIPVRRELGAGLRRMFVAGEGCVLVDADYSQIELRLLAHISGDENMRAAFLSGEDVHRVTASQVFDIPLEQVTAEERRRAKAVNFGIVYGISPFSLSQEIHTSVAEAREYMDAYLRRFSGVRDYQKAIVEKAHADGYVTTLFHRRRYLPELKGNFTMRSFGERVALNMPIQGTAADIIKLAMVHVDARLRKEGLRARLLLQVHDELIVECPEEERERVAALLQEEMEQVVSYSVPLVAEAGWGKTWAEAH
ncbi:MAG: DNA polymerase I [Oscillospiraceae bacterium]|nr:DNA polymerase I [Oscillospiraceae bacterium]